MLSSLKIQLINNIPGRCSEMHGCNYLSPASPLSSSRRFHVCNLNGERVQRARAYNLSVDDREPNSACIVASEAYNHNILITLEVIWPISPTPTIRLPVLYQSCHGPSSFQTLFSPNRILYLYLLVILYLIFFHSKRGHYRRRTFHVTFCRRTANQMNCHRSDFSKHHHRFKFEWSDRDNKSINEAAPSLSLDDRTPQQI